MSVRTYGFLGLGVIGASLAMALKEQDPDCIIVAKANSEKTIRYALDNGIADVAASSPSDPVFKSCRIIFLCAPVETNEAMLPEVVSAASEDCLITDVGSVKSGIHKAAAELGINKRFIGGHPMTGSEKSGIENAGPHLFENSFYILTPTKESDPKLLNQYHDLVTAIGALPLVLDPKEHDFATAAISHLPHLVAAALVNTVHTLDSPDETMKLIAAGGFRDITRIASSSPQMWEEICMDNNENITEVMDEFIAQIEAARNDLVTKNGSGINQMFTESREYRDSFAFSSPGPIKKTFAIHCDIIDEAGAIATIATILAVAGISIKNIGIVHNREFEEGALRIEFYDEEPAMRAASILRHHRYTVWDGLTK